MQMDAFERVKRVEIVAQILELGQKSWAGSLGRERWGIPFLTHLQIREFLSFSVRNGLVAYVRKDGAYKTTPKGSDFLRSYRALCDLLQ